MSSTYAGIFDNFGDVPNPNDRLVNKEFFIAEQVTIETKFDLVKMQRHQAKNVALASPTMYYYKKSYLANLTILGISTFSLILFFMGVHTNLVIPILGMVGSYGMVRTIISAAKERKKIDEERD